MKIIEISQKTFENLDISITENYRKEFGYKDSQEYRLPNMVYLKLKNKFFEIFERWKLEGSSAIKSDFFKLQNLSKKFFNN